MRGFARALMVPAMRLARATLADGDSLLPDADAPAHAHAAGSTIYRVLVVGNGAARGYGVRTHDLGLPGTLARAISAATGRGVDVDVVTESSLSLARVVDAVRSRGLTRYDSIVLVAGEDEALELLPLDEWDQSLTAVLRDLRAMCGSGAALVVAGVAQVGPIGEFPRAFAALAEAHGRRLDEVSRQVCTSDPAARFVPLPPTSATTAAELYRTWAELIAAEVTSADLVRVRGPIWPSIDESRRQQSVSRLGLAETRDYPPLQHIVEMARHALGVETALLTVLDGDVQLHVAKAGTTVTRIPRSDSFCQHAIEQPDELIIEDARLDDRFKDNPLVTGEPHIRFYAGLPVAAPDGERLGALCVFDSSPRRAQDVDTTFLRELARFAQNELWRDLSKAAASPIP